MTVSSLYPKIQSSRILFSNQRDKIIAGTHTPALGKGVSQGDNINGSVPNRRWIAKPVLSLVYVKYSPPSLQTTVSFPAMLARGKSSVPLTAVVADFIVPSFCSFSSSWGLSEGTASMPRLRKSSMTSALVRSSYLTPSALAAVMMVGKIGKPRREK